MRHDGGEERQDQQLTPRPPAVAVRSRRSARGRQRPDRPSRRRSGPTIKPAGQPMPARRRLPSKITGSDDAEQPAAGQEGEEQVALAAAAHQPQPAQRVVEDADEEEDLGRKLEQAAAHQRVERFVVRAIGRGVARLEMAQVGRIEPVERDPQRFRPVADERADRRPARPARRPGPAAGACGVIRSTTPSQISARTAFVPSVRLNSVQVRLMYRTWHSALQRTVRHIQNHEQRRRGDSHADQPEPRGSQRVVGQPAQECGAASCARRPSAPAAAGPAWRTRTSPAARPSCGPRLCVKTMVDELDDEDEEVCARPQRIAQMPLSSERMSAATLLNSRSSVRNTAMMR